MPHLFAEEFETGIPGSFDTVQADFGSLNCIWDRNSMISESGSLRFDVFNEVGGGASKNLGSDYTELYIQFKGYFQAGTIFGVSGYTGFMVLQDAVPASRLTFNIEDYGTVKLTVNGDFSYHTMLDLPQDEVWKLEIYVKKHATLGRIKAWLNNDNSASPDYDSGDTNTAATAFRTVKIGPTYSPEAVKSWWIDDVYFDTSFIGAGIPLEQEGYRFRADDGSETTATWLASQDSNISRARNLNTRLRTILNTSGDPYSRTYQLEYRRKGSGQTWRKVPSS